jgi:lipopolysaccharide export system ATP-binding protein
VAAALEAVGLAKSFKARVVVDDVDLKVAPGEVVGLLGPNGAGKTTTFKMMLGLVRPDRGTVRFGVPLDGLPLYMRARMGLGYLPQGPSVFQGLSVRDNPLALLEALGKPDPARRTDELLAKFGLSHLAHQKARTLSGGERRRLEFARALCSDPSILLCDEPFCGVDPIAASKIAEAVLELKGDGVGVLLTDQSVREALSVCDRIYLIAQGKIVEEGSAAEILDSDVAKRLYLGPRFTA